ncbi:CoA-transferase family III domain-containing protein [Hyaloraphidium curvatum]|nr:CoA-transferase family III domain-containing protein [Hyaloraphidium curvatum]
MPQGTAVATEVAPPTIGKKPAKYKGHPFPKLQAPTSRPPEHVIEVRGAPSVRAEARKAAALILKELGFTDVDTPGSETAQLLQAVKLEGNDVPYFPSVVKLTEGISGVHIALSVVANKLTKMKMGKYQDVSLNTDHAFQTLNSQYAITVKGIGGINQLITCIEDDDELRPPDYHFRYLWGNIFSTKDNNFIFLSAKFDKPEKLLASTGFEKEEIKELLRSDGKIILDPKKLLDAVEKKISTTWNALDIEDAMTKKHHCAVVPMTTEEFMKSEQGRALSSKPAVEIDPIPHPDITRNWPAAGLPDVPQTSPPRLLLGVKIIELTRVLAGPRVGTCLASYGTTNTKVSSADLEDFPHLVYDTNVGKRSIFLDLKSKEGKAKMRELVSQADMIISNYAWGALDRLGFGPRQCAEIIKDRNRGIIYVETNAFGFHGPQAKNPGFDKLAQMITGVCYEQGKYTLYDPAPSKVIPTSVPMPFCDMTTGHLGALGGMTALYRRAVHGGSYLVRASLTQTAMWYQRLGYYAPEVSRQLMAGYPKQEVDPPLFPPRIDSFLASEILPVYRPDVYEDRFFFTSRGPFGEIRTVRPPVKMSLTPLRYVLPARPIGFDPEQKFYTEDEKIGADIAIEDSSKPRL